MITPRVVFPPAVEVVSLDEAKLHCKVDGTEEDALFGIYIPAARQYFEDAAQYSIHEQTLEISLDRWPYFSSRNYQSGFNPGVGSFIELPRATPLIDITSIGYFDSSGNLFTMDPSGYVVDTYSMPGRVYLQVNTQWPSVILAAANGIVIRYRAGLATALPIADPGGAIKLPILMLVAGMYANRESETWEDNRATLIAAISMRYGVEAFIARVRDRVAPTSY